jgi:hypothetical protein
VLRLVPFPLFPSASNGALRLANIIGIDIPIPHYCSRAVFR